MSKSNDNLLLYAAIGIGAFLILSKKKVATSIPVTTNSLLPGGTSVIQAQAPNVLSTLTSGLSNIFDAFKNNVPDAPASTNESGTEIEDFTAGVKTDDYYTGLMQSELDPGNEYLSESFM